VITRKKKGFKFNVSINREKGIIRAWPKEFPIVYANITIGELLINQKMNHQSTKKFIHPASYDTNMVKIVKVPMFLNNIPSKLNGTAVLSEGDEWNETYGINLAVNKSYRKAFAFVKEAVIRGVGQPDGKPPRR
jgi:hypothetical protein